MLTSVRTCTPTPSCLEVPPCTQVLPTECKRKSLPWLHPPLRSGSLLHQKENTPYGSEGYAAGYGYGLGALGAPLVGHPNGALVPAETAEVAAAKADFLATFNMMNMPGADK